jgi:hypothetical protein
MDSSLKVSISSLCKKGGDGEAWYYEKNIRPGVLLLTNECSKV